jgi:hypothetical protein
MAWVLKVLPEEGFQRLVATNGGDAPGAFDGMPLEENWQPPTLVADDPTLEAPDVWACFGRTDVYAFTENAFAELIQFLDEAGETLPADVDGRKVWLLNVTRGINCLKRSSCEFDPNDPAVITNYIFHTDRVVPSLFKIPETRATDLLCGGHVVASVDEFQTVFEELDLTGLRFDRIWVDLELFG